MSFLDRSVPLKHAILAVITIAVLVGASVHFLQERSDEIAHFGSALPAEVVKADNPKTAGSIFGLWGHTYTNAEVKVTQRSGEAWYYPNVPLGGQAVVGQKLKAWVYDGDFSRAYFSGGFNMSTKETQATPWPSVEDKLAMAFGCMFVAAFFTFFILLFLSPRKKKPNQSPEADQKPAAKEKPAIFDGADYV